MISSVLVQGVTLAIAAWDRTNLGLAQDTSSVSDGFCTFVYLCNGQSHSRNRVGLTVKELVPTIGVSSTTCANRLTPLGSVNTAPIIHR